MGGKLKDVGVLHWSSPNDGATNSSGFTALPGGFRHYDNVVFGDLGLFGGFWSSTGAGNIALIRMLRYFDAMIFRNYAYADTGYSCRCVMD